MTLLNTETIAAISTPFGSAGIGKIRMSGPEAITIAASLFKSVKKEKDLREAASYTAHYGYIVDSKSGKEADEVICIIMKGPHSFTGEDVVELDCHGGMVPLQRVLDILLQNGARLAEPGEFSKRAFLNGRIDLAQAEGIMEVINSKTEKGLDVALNQLGGKLSSQVGLLKDKVIELMAYLEAAIDFPEDEVEGFKSKELGDKLYSIKDGIKELLETSRQGKIYREGIKTVIVGKPNVGKSSLLNTLLEEKRAIVTDVPGTTRDIIEEFINIKGIPLKIIDTAGIRKTEDLVEKIGVKKAEETLKKADLILMMIDISQGLTEVDLMIYQLIKEKPLIVIVNKTDLPAKVNFSKLRKEFTGHPLLEISIKEDQGLNELKEAIIDEVLDEELKSDEEVFITRTRHKNALEHSLQAIKRVIKTYQEKLPYDFFTIDLRDCLIGLSDITGETLADDIIDRIFKDFCLGK
ncbi:tRNA uridine-5-carboxymethylaminomethyl(34) synthesis GTPase MnmE [Halocella sp. SP3-1]|uniref:tRNA uridine-5-carboxymethylaminomethyl(34) synthesis GTPase MnmE n=1 Tax=Halocella sp. SP3-1 TaxID=2382161 RepID=UPI000F7587B6|nr:tRNA uridine-5-carboxymethylaminomethyl(34) synthesis GTPase MnmE [Halocella sp. SP3-1]AZO93595.1 tRNA uridine-5-carboxymethylaminomethyl(34) synthesis GTPase MnmE [Halocella sp. SP3-1]